ncbi:MAG: hypothetical protein WBD78_07415 [Methylocella sp.]
MPVAGGGFEPCCNAQAAVAAGSLPVVPADVVPAPNGKPQLAPVPGKTEMPLAGAGYFRAANAGACGKAGIEPPIAMGRQPRHPP